MCCAHMLVFIMYVKTLFDIFFKRTVLNHAWIILHVDKNVHILSWLYIEPTDGQKNKKIHYKILWLMVREVLNTYTVNTIHKMMRHSVLQVYTYINEYITIYLHIIFFSLVWNKDAQIHRSEFSVCWLIFMLTYCLVSRLG